MRKFCLQKRIYYSLIFYLVLLCTSTSLWASGFQIYEQSAAGLGDYHAGGAAIADSASTNFYNPAGLVRLHHPQFSLGWTAINIDTQFSGTISGLISAPYQNYDGGIERFIPNIHIAWPLTARFSLGVSVVTPFGLATDWPADSDAAVVATESQFKTLDITPAFGWALNRHVAVGFGIDWQKLSFILNNYVLANFKDENSGAAWRLGWHAGILWQLDPHNRIGFAYHAQMDYAMKGTSRIFNTDGSLNNISTQLAMNLPLPGYGLLSYYHDINRCWTLLASVMYTRWNVLQNITLHQLANLGGGTIASLTIPQHFRNTWNVALGLHYHLNQAITFKFGIGFDENPTNNQDRNIRLPDANRWALALGIQDRTCYHLIFDAGFTHLFVRKTTIENTALVPFAETMQGSVQSSANLIGIQMSYLFSLVVVSTVVVVVVRA